MPRDREWSLRRVVSIVVGSCLQDRILLVHPEMRRIFVFTIFTTAFFFAVAHVVQSLQLQHGKSVAPCALVSYPERGLGTRLFCRLKICVLRIKTGLCGMHSSGLVSYYGHAGLTARLDAVRVRWAGQSNLR